MSAYHVERNFSGAFALFSLLFALSAWARRHDKSGSW